MSYAQTEMKKIYISGPMTGIADFNFPSFNKAASELRAKGHTVINPAEKQDEGNPDMTWYDYMRQDIRMMMDCDTIFMLPGWSCSKGAKIEWSLAVALGFEVSGAEA